MPPNVTAHTFFFLLFVPCFSLPSPSFPLSLFPLLHKAELLFFSSFILIPLAVPCPHPLSCWSSDGIDRRVAGLLIAAPNKWNRGKMEEGGKEGKGGK